MRSQAEGSSQLFATTNPDMDSWVLDFVKWYLNEEGFPDPERNGKIRYFLIVDDSPVFADTEEELAKDYPNLCYHINDVTGETQYIPPLSICVLLGTIFDNPELIRTNPKYLSSLKAQSSVNRKRLLDGCWYARAEGSNYFDRNWLHKLDKKPFGCIEARGWDLASSEPSEKYRHPDYTASVKMLKTKDGRFVIVGDYDPATLDPKTNIMGRFQKRPGDRDQTMLNQSILDGSDCVMILPKDPSASGDYALKEQIKYFNKHGFTVKKDPTPNNKSKLKRFEPFATACEQGLVSIVESTFNKQTLDHFYKELEAFDGERSTASRKDDLPDSAASVYSYLVGSKSHKAIPFSSIDSPTMKAQMGL